MTIKSSLSAVDTNSGMDASKTKQLDALLLQLQRYADKDIEHPKLSRSAAKQLLELVAKSGNSIRAKGEVVLSLFDAKRIESYQDFKTSYRRRRQSLVDEPDIGNNLVVDTGLLQIGRLWLGVDALVATYSQVGTSSTAAAAGQTVLLGPITPRVAISEKFQVSNVSHADTFYTASQGNGTLFESGLFNDPTAGSMFCRRVLGSSKVKDSTKTMTLQWSVTLIGV